MKMTWTNDLYETWISNGRQELQTFVYFILRNCPVLGTNHSLESLTQFTGNVTSNVSRYFLLQAMLVLFLIYLIKQLLHGLPRSTKKPKPKIPTCLFDMAKVAYKPEICNRLINTLKDLNDFDANQKMPKTMGDATDNQMTLFQCACFSGNERILRFLLYNGADIHTRTKWDDVPLHLVVFALSANKNNDLGAIEILLEAGCDINCKNWIGNTPLSVAASHGNIKLIKYLLARGANPSIPNNKGIHPIDFANNADYKDAADLLVFDVPNPYVWDVIEPHTPPKIKLGLQSPSKQHLADSTFTRRQGQRKRDKRLY